jgi:hypothetical protein
MNPQARQLLNNVCAEPAFSREMLAPLRETGDFVDELEDAIERAAGEERWGCVCRLVWVAQRFPNQRLVPLLSRLLDVRNDVYLEAVVDALTIMPDARAVDALIRALSYRMRGDELAFHFNRKVINALSFIGTESAIAGIREALNDSEEIVRSFAAEILRILADESQ